MGVLDILFPKYCVVCKRLGEYLCPDCFARVSFDVMPICLVCNRQAIYGRTHPGCRTKYTIDGALASLVYAGVVKKLVYQFKYKPFLTDLQRLLGDFMFEGLIQQEQFHRLLQTDCILVPIPLHSSRQRERGYNHAQLLSKMLGQRVGLRTVCVLKRIKRTETQANLKKDKRLENIRGAFACDESVFKTLNGEQVILVDDIFTTGATMMEAAATLKRSGVKKIWGIALAHGI